MACSPRSCGRSAAPTRVGQGRHSFTDDKKTLRRLNTVFAAFYARGKKKQGKAGYPRFKPYSRFNQAGFAAGDGANRTPA